MIIQLAERLRELRESHHLTQKQLAQDMEVTRASVNAWEMGISLPTVSKLVDLAQRFHVSTDYLLGLASGKSIDVHNFTPQEQEILCGLMEYFQKVHNKTDDTVEGVEQVK